MENFMNQEEFKKFSEQYDLLPFAQEFYADSITPVQVLKRLKEVDNKVFLLESANNSGVRGRYSFLGFNPSLEIIVNNNKVIVRKDNRKKEFEGNPTQIIEDIMAQNKSPIIEDLPPFTGGLIGYVSYDYYKYTEPVLKFENPDPFEFYDLHLFMINDLIVFDHFKDKIILITNINLKKNQNWEFIKELENNLKVRINEIKKIIETFPETTYQGEIIEDFKPTFNEAEYKEVIAKIRQYIIAGDIFQAVMSNRLKGKVKGSLFSAYRVVRSDNPSPYMYYMQFEDKEIIGTSPETLVKLEENIITTFPIAGSRPRGKTPEEDRRLEEELLSDPKELAEHNMLVDLGRNDIGRVAKYKSVKVDDYLFIQKYSKIMHITSKVSGVIKDNVSALEALGNILPAGTLSGAPKIRACQIIEEMEKERRGPYGGAVGYLAFNGNMDMCIAIRSAFKSGDDVYIQSGGGIVYDSNAHNEYIETVNKAGAVVEAIEKSENLKNDFNFR